MRFIDLFAGLGGFHVALSELGHECVFASEINEELQILYEKNFSIKCSGDINQVDINHDIPAHDILCGGFPCQPFSQAGAQLGLEDPRNGNLFNKIMEILEAHTPEFVFLENVPNLKGHDNGNTWTVIESKLSKLYDVKETILSPHNFGIPQHRTRIYIVGRLKTAGGLANFEFPEKEEKETSIHDIIIEDDDDYLTLKDATKNHLKVWQEFIDKLDSKELPTFPVWAMEFGANYPYEGIAPYKRTKKDLEKYKGAFGQPVTGNSKDDCLLCLPIYAQSDKSKEFPDWKKLYIQQNREFYNKHKSWLDDWIPKITNFENSHQKFEWNCGYEEKPLISNKIVQFRPSGIRVKKTDLFSGISCYHYSNTHIPVVIEWRGAVYDQKGSCKTAMHGKH